MIAAVVPLVTYYPDVLADAAVWMILVVGIFAAVLTGPRYS